MKPKCPICKGKLILELGTGTKWGTMANGSATCDGHYTVIEGVYCEKCGIMMKTFVLGKFFITRESPFWQPLKNEKCDKSCCYFSTDGMCRSNSLTFTHKGKVACRHYRPFG